MKFLLCLVAVSVCVALTYGESCTTVDDCDYETCSEGTLACLRGQCSCDLGDEETGGFPGFEGGEFPGFEAGEIPDFEGGEFPGFEGGEIPAFEAGEFPAFEIPEEK